MIPGLSLKLIGPPTAAERAESRARLAAWRDTPRCSRPGCQIHVDLAAIEQGEIEDADTRGSYRGETTE
jgi:hypothetical protein